MGKHDNRVSSKMRRRKAQVKKKARLKRQALERKAAHAPGAKKAPSRRASKPAAVIPPIAPAVIDVPPAVVAEGAPPVE